MRGNVVDMAVGIIIGAAFSSITNSLVSDLLMPPVGLLTGNVNFNELFLVLKQGKTPPPYNTLAQAEASGAVTINYGVFINKLISFLIVAFVMFLLIRYINKLNQKLESTTPEEQAVTKTVPTTKQCPYCLSTIPVKATRCPQCTSDLTGEEESKPS